MNLKTLSEIRKAVEGLSTGLTKTYDLAYKAFHSPARNWFGQQPVWDDLRVSLERANNQGGATPTYTIFKNGTKAYRFANGNALDFTVQLPHGWKEGTTIYPHLHWCPTTNVSPSDNVGIGFEYTWASIGGAWGATTTVTRDVATGVNSAYKHIMNDFDDDGIDATGQTVSSVLVCRVFRQAAAADDYASGAFFLELDFHYQADTFGSYRRNYKWGQD